MTELSKEDQKKMNELQIMEQSRQQINMQKQAVTTQIFEIESALNEIEKTSEAYKFVGSVLVKKDPKILAKELEEEKELKEKQIEKLQQQEEKFDKKIEDLRKDLLKSMK